MQHLAVNRQLRQTLHLHLTTLLLLQTSRPSNQQKPNSPPYTDTITRAGRKSI